jgi:acid phosphatase
MEEIRRSVLEVAMCKRKPFVILLLVVAVAISTKSGRASELPYCDVPLKLPESSFAREMTLIQLQVVIRHGDRTPSAKVPTGTVPWVCEPFAHTLRFLDVSPQAVNQEINGPFSYPPSCTGSQLTVKGRDQHLALGAAMRKKYVERLGFLPPSLNPGNQGQLLFRSTDYPRTRQSGQAFLVSLYPVSYRIGNPVLTLQIRDIECMALDPGFCPKLNTLYKSGYPGSKLYAEIVKENLPAVREAGVKIGTWNVGTDPETKAEEEKAAFFATITAADNLFARVCHGKELPEGIGMEDVRALRAATDQYGAGFSTYDRPSPEAARLIIGLFVKEIRDKILRAAKGAPAPRMTLYSAHDLTLWSLLAALSQDNDVTIPYASHIAFELWQDRHGDHWVAVEFNGDYLTVGECPSSLCTLVHFVAAIERYVPVDFEQECSEP